MGTKFFIAVGLLPVELIPYHAKLQRSVLKTDIEVYLY